MSSSSQMTLRAWGKHNICAVMTWNYTMNMYPIFAWLNFEQTHLLAKMHLCTLMMRPSTSMLISAKISDSKTVPIRVCKSRNAERWLSLFFSAAFSRSLASCSASIEEAFNLPYQTSKSLLNPSKRSYADSFLRSCRSEQRSYVQAPTLVLFTVFLQFMQRIRSSPIQPWRDLTSWRRQELIWCRMTMTTERERENPIASLDRQINARR